MEIVKQTRPDVNSRLFFAAHVRLDKILLNLLEPVEVREVLTHRIEARFQLNV